MKDFTEIGDGRRESIIFEVLLSPKTDEISDDIQSSDLVTDRILSPGP